MPKTTVSFFNSAACVILTASVVGWGVPHCQGLETKGDAASEATSGDLQFFEIAAKLDYEQVYRNRKYLRLFRGNCDFKCPNGGIPTQKPSHLPTLNGCGSYGIKFDLMNNVPEIKECCNVHDACYEICMEGQNTCDTDFHECILRYCEQKYSDSYIKAFVCRQVANVSYIAVNGFGCRTYLDFQEQACVCPSRRKRRVLTRLTRKVRTI